LALLIPCHVLEVNDAAFEDVKSAPRIEWLKIVRESNLYAPHSGFLQVSNRSANDASAKPVLPALWMDGQI
jgi:hypothetical protein